MGNLVGGMALDTLIGVNGLNVWSITSNNGGTVAGIDFSSFENLTGGSGNDSFVLGNGLGVAGVIQGGGGVNTLDYSAYSTGVSVKFTNGSGDGDRWDQQRGELDRRSCF
ncbi:MAG: hypothetical protein HC904_12490 [Blastochloris sp.]|nr:hypothetical protein [Blastochloris sp.]